MANQYVPYQIYCNLFEFMKYRGLAPEKDHMDRDVSEPAPSDTIVPLIKQFEYYQINTRVIAARPGLDEKGSVVIIMLTPDSKYAHHSSDLRHLVGGLSGRIDNLQEMVLITEEEFFAKKNLMDLIHDLRKNNPKIYYSVFPYTVFATIIPKVIIIPKHVVITSEEAQAFLGQEKLVGQIPPILSSDPIIVWIGGRVGDYIKVYRPSESCSLASTAIRIVKPG